LWVAARKGELEMSAGVVPLEVDVKKSAEIARLVGAEPYGTSDAFEILDHEEKACAWAVAGLAHLPNDALYWEGVVFLEYDYLVDMTGFPAEHYWLEHEERIIDPVMYKRVDRTTYCGGASYTKAEVGAALEQISSLPLIKRERMVSEQTERLRAYEAAESRAFALERAGREPVSRIGAADYHALAEKRRYRWVGSEAVGKHRETLWECKKRHPPVQFKASYYQLDRAPLLCPACGRTSLFAAEFGPRAKEIAWREHEVTRLEKAGEVDAAIRLYEAIIADDYKKGGWPYERLRIIYRKRKDYENALRICRAAVALFEELILRPGDYRGKDERKMSRNLRAYYVKERDRFLEWIEKLEASQERAQSRQRGTD
jgi:hypothetical protein